GRGWDPCRWAANLAAFVRVCQLFVEEKLLIIEQNGYFAVGGSGRRCAVKSQRIRWMGGGALWPSFHAYPHIGGCGRSVRVIARIARAVEHQTAACQDEPGRYFNRGEGHTRQATHGTAMGAVEMRVGVLVMAVVAGFVAHSEARGAR